MVSKNNLQTDPYSLIESAESATDELAISIISNSCIGKKDGIYYLKLADESTVSSFISYTHTDSDTKLYPIVKIKCSNEYIILNPKDEPLITEYFTSFLKWQRFVSGPSNTHVINWEQWYLPNEESEGQTSYIISPDCSVCEEDHSRQLYSTKTVYMMTGTMFGCFWNFLGEHNFDEDWESYQCYYNPSYSTDSINLNSMGELTPFELNDYSLISDWDHSGVCAFNVRQSDFNINGFKHELCTVDYSGEDDIDSSTANIEMGYHLKPSIGIDGTNCVCVKPSELRHFEVMKADVTKAKEINSKYILQLRETEKKQQLLNDLEETDDIMNIPRDNIYYIYQSDFEHGTLRIRQSGIYIVMEDITFDFNNGNLDDPTDTQAWWPYKNQHKLYPGAQSFRDPYFLGFWAGITIEVNNVILDLNGHELVMSDAFYYQQRWFTTIALQSQYFLPGQGPGFFGAEPLFASHIIIRNGILGQSSHHNIHGHYNHDILIENIHCKHFETHGIQFNGFDGITMKNIEIGPSSTKVYLRGTFGHARNLLPRLQQIADAQQEDEEKYIHFHGRNNPVSIQQIHDDLKFQLNTIFRYVITGVEPDIIELDPDDADEDEEPGLLVLTQSKWDSILSTFYNPTGLPHGAGMYGIFLNTVGASVLTYNLQTSTYSSDITLENINIHNLKHSMIEFIRIGVPSSGSIYLNALHGCLDARDMLNNIENVGEDDYVATYKGNILTDATIAMEYFSNNWDILQASLIWGDRIFPWVTGNDLNALGEYNIGCNSDAQVHGAKGLTGIRIDGVNGVKLSNIQITDMIESTPPGLRLCGQYTSFDRDCIGKCGGHIRQKEPMQVGFSGHNLQGICLNAAKNVIVGKTNINGLQSYYGLTYGISVWPSVDITFNDKISVTNLLAGVDYHNILNENDSGNILYDIDDDDEQNNYPNRIPEVCAIRIVNKYYSETADKIYTSSVQFDTSSHDEFNGENDILITNIDGYRTCYVDSNADDYYDSNAPHHDKSSKSSSSITSYLSSSSTSIETMIGQYMGDDPNFVGIGKYGISSIKKYKLQHHHINNHGAYSWIQRNIKFVIFAVVILIVICLAVIIKQFYYKYFYTQTLSILDSKEVKKINNTRTNGRVVLLQNSNNNNDNTDETTPLL